MHCKCPPLTQSGHRASLNGPHLNRYDVPGLSLGGGNETARVHHPFRRSPMPWLLAAHAPAAAAFHNCSADGVPKERPGRPQVQSAGFREREAHVGRSARFQLISAWPLLAAR
jgi:hypothetical protein